MSMPIDPTYSAGTGWTVQKVADVQLLFDYPAYTGSHSTPATINPAELQLSNNAADTFTVTTKEVDLTGAVVLPAGFSLNASTGAISIDGATSVAGAYVLGLVVTDALGQSAESDAIITLT
jgi:hypothetical protein